MKKISFFTLILMLVACVFANAQTVSEKLEAKALENLFGSGAYLTGSEPQEYYFYVEGYDIKEITLAKGDTAIITIDVSKTGFPISSFYLYNPEGYNPCSITSQTDTAFTFTYTARDSTDGDWDTIQVTCEDYDFILEINVEAKEFDVTDFNENPVENGDCFTVEEPDIFTCYYFTIENVKDVTGLTVTKVSKTGDLEVYAFMNGNRIEIWYESGCGQVEYKITKLGYNDFYFSVIFEEIPVEEIIVDPEEVTLAPDYNIYLYATVYPDNATYQEVHWESNDEDIAIVGPDGNVTAVAPGLTEIICWNYDETVFGSCIVKVESPDSVKIYKGETDVTGQTLEMSVLDFDTFTAEVESETLSDKVTWSTDNWNVVRILSNGAYNAKKYGTALITCASKDNPEVKASVTINVVPDYENVSVSIEGDSEITMNTGDEQTLIAKVLPEKEIQAVTWTCDNWNVVSVVSGKITAKKVGTATITATSKADPSKSANVVVNVVPNEEATIEIKGDSYILIGKTINLSAVITPATESQAVTWSTSDWNIAKVVNGMVTGKKEGTVTITAQSKDNPELTATKTVYVVTEEDMPKFEVNPHVIAGGVGVMTVLVADTNINGFVKWTVDDKNIASVNPKDSYSCQVTNLAVGTTKVVATITDKYGTVFTQEINVTVHE